MNICPFLSYLLIIIICLIIGGIIGSTITYFILKPSIQATININKKTQEENQKIESHNQVLTQECQEIQKNRDSLNQDINILITKKENLVNSINDLKKIADESSQTFYNQAMENMQLRFEQSADKERIKYQQAINQYRTEYEQTIAELVEQMQVELSGKEEQLAILSDALKREKIVVDSAVAANKRAYEIKQQGDFYRLNIPKEDLLEIKKLKEIIPYLRDPEALNKVIYKIYYEKPYSDLIGRVIGTGVKTGIYKITNIINQMCYVGQSTNIADRWKQHIKRGIGAEAPTKNKLYPAMLKDGIENFTFEVIEECPRAELNDKEDYWQEYFKAKEFGYSIK